MAPPPSVWILVLNYQSLEDTLGCVDSIRAIDYPNLHLLVLDNASPDGSGRALAEKLPSSEFVQLPENTGYAGGNNHGIRLALQKGADYVFIVNPDVRLARDCVTRYLDAFSTDPSWGALNSVQVQSGGLTVDPKFAQAILQPMGYADVSYFPDRLPAIWESNTLLGAALMLRSSCLQRVGGFDPLYFAYGEEEDLCRRIRQHGFRLAVVSAPAVVHLRTAETAAVSDFVLFLRLKGACLFRIKDPQTFFIESFLSVLGELGRGLLGHYPNQYPYNRFSIRRRHVASAMLWLLTHALSAFRHRRQEIKGRMYV